MGLLKSVNNVPDIDFYEYREIDFYNKYKYRARVSFEGLYLTYWAKDIQDYVRILNNRKPWRKIDKASILQNLSTIEKYIEFKNLIKKDNSISLRTEGDTAGIFSNDLNKLKELKNLGNCKVDITEALTSQFSGVKYFVNEPKHKYRVYFRSKYVDVNFHGEFGEFLSKNKNIYPSKALDRWVNKVRQSNWHFRYLSGTFFIDYDDDSVLSYLSLMYGEILGKKFKLEKRP